MVNGRFYFTQTQNGNLLGEYSNSKSDRNVTESADLTSEFAAGNLVGTYISTWFHGKPHSLTLVVEEKSGTSGILSIRWHKNEKTVFFGEGFITQNLLIGNYWDDEVEEQLRGLLD